VIDALVVAGLPVKICCRTLGVSSPGNYKYRHRPLAPTKMRRQWLTGLIREVRVASRGTYGARRVHAEFTLGMGIVVSDSLVAILMHNAGIYGLPGPAKIKRLRGIVTPPNEINLWEMGPVTMRRGMWVDEASRLAILVCYDNGASRVAFDQVRGLRVHCHPILR
jgi:hypothetical protein